MPTINDILSYLPEIDPLILIIGGVVAVLVLLFAVRILGGLAVRILSIGCAILVILAIIWFVWQILIPIF
jgi:predicted tellurium resistance membrane protein TerC